MSIVIHRECSCFGGVLLEHCVFCDSLSDTWHTPTNNPVCISCAEIHSVSELIKVPGYKNTEKNFCWICGKPDEKIKFVPVKYFKNKFLGTKKLIKNLTAKDMAQIIKLSVDYVGDDYDMSKIHLKKYVHKDTDELLYIQADIPIPKDYELGLQIVLYNNGYLSYENLTGTKFRFDNPLEVYKIIIDRFK